MADLQSKKRSRTGFVIFINKLKKQVESLLSDESIDDIDKLETLKLTLEDKLKLVIELTEEIGHLLTEDEEFQQDFAKYMDFELEIRTLINIIGKKVSSERKTENISDTSSSKKSSQAQNFTKLPQIQIKKFNGDPLNWNTFIETFNAAVDNNEHLSDVQKMTYLMNYLVGEAEMTLKGLKLCNNNYAVAKKLLEERYGDPQVLISSHMSKLLAMPTVQSISDVKGLRRLYDTIETQVRSLNCLDVDVANYGSMLIPVILSKLPPEFKLIISREFDKTLWDIQTLMTLFKKELEARERALGNNDMVISDNERKLEVRSGHTLHTQNGKQAKKLICVFCEQSHKHKDCSVVTKVESRKQILLDKKKCFICLKFGHMAKNCRSTYKCFKCDGRHNIIICDGKADKKSHDEKSNSASSPATTSSNISAIDIQKIVDMINASSENSNENIEQAKETASHVSLYENNSVLLQTATAVVSSTSPSSCSPAAFLRILFDSGSQMSYISPKATELLKLESLGEQKISVKTFGQHKETKVLKEVQFSVKTLDSSNVKVNALVSDICFPLTGQHIAIAKKEYPHIKNLNLADNNKDSKPLSIDVLIGADHYWDFIENKTIVKAEDGPVAIPSKLGYILSGKVKSKNPTSQSTNLIHTHTLKCQVEYLPDIKVKNDLKHFWSTEKLGTENVENDDVIKTFNDSLKFNGERYEVDFPFKENFDVILEDNYSLSKKRLKGTLKVFKNDHKLLETYDEIIKEQLQFGVIEPAPSTSTVGQVRYLPHRPIVRQDKATTKVRMVFDASAKGQGPSLNDCLHAGPPLATSLFGNLLRFRSHKVAVVADIEKAFLQISINEKQRDFVRFLWFKDINNIDFEQFENNDFYDLRFCRVIFGVTSSPFLLTGTLVNHIKKYENSDPTTVQKLLSSLHVDDLNSGDSNVENSLKLYKNSKNILADAQFNLRKFRSNSSELEHLVKTEMNEEISDEKKVLGIYWDKSSDTFYFNLAEIVDKFHVFPTKRQVIQALASIYDPLGLINPIIVKLKLFYQNLCTFSKMDWDQQIPDELLKEWQEIIRDFQKVSFISIPRCYFTHHDIYNVQLHGFSDASTKAKGCVFYLRISYTDGSITSNLVTSKSRVNSVRKRSMPKLELSAALLMMRVHNILIQEFTLTLLISKIYLWMDSSVAFAWIQNGLKKYNKFIQDRLDKIQKLRKSATIKLIDSKSNPADISSKGATPEDLHENQLWFHGPAFLTKSEAFWPDYKIGDSFIQGACLSAAPLDSNVSKGACLSAAPNSDVSVCVSKGACLSAAPTSEVSVCVSQGACLSAAPFDCVSVSEGACLSAAPSYDSDSDTDSVCDRACLSAALISDNPEVALPYQTADFSEIISLERFSSLPKLLRVTSLVLRFIRRLRERGKQRNRNRKINNIDLVYTADELKIAEVLWIITAQKLFDSKSKTFKHWIHNLRLFYDGVAWRCGGRLDNADIDYDTNNPYLLPKDSYFSKLIVLDCHKRVGHNKVKDTLNELRNKYWIVKGRSYIKKLLHDCVLCRKYEGQPYKYPEQPSLPSARVKVDHAFSTIGLDYAGPYLVKDIYENKCEHCDQLHKTWIVLITCCSSRCIYLDLVPDCTSEECIEALKRFNNKRGAPKLIISDNGGAFISNDVQNFAASNGTNWSFNTPSAPWTGGFFERLVKSVKRCLKKILGNSKVTYLELLTILTHIENVLNNRPLTFLYDDPADSALTPYHLLYGRKLETNVRHSNQEQNDDKIIPEKRMTYIQTLVQQFWCKWKKEYLLELREHYKTINRCKNGYDISIDDVVLIEDDKNPRQKWKLARVHELIYSKDGKIRTAAVEYSTENGKLIIRRPINRLYPVELNIAKAKPKLTFVHDDDIPLIVIK